MGNNNIQVWIQAENKDKHNFSRDIYLFSASFKI